MDSRKSHCSQPSSFCFLTNLITGDRIPTEEREESIPLISKETSKDTESLLEHALLLEKSTFLLLCS